MKVLVDITHPAEVNFLKNAINIMIEKNCDVDVITRPRGGLIDIINQELDNVQITNIGKHYQSTIGKLYGLITRTIQLLKFISTNRSDIFMAFGSFYVSFASHFYEKPCILFVDDYEYKITYYLCKLTARYLVMPTSIPATGKNMLKYNGFKELAYLHPTYFKPDRKVLEQSGLTPNNYVFIREVSRISLNYKNLQQMDIPEVIRRLKKSGLDVVLSLEDKTLADSLKDKCIVLEEPVRDIFSLMHFALFTISSSDTMARESCLVGTPTIYTGGRDMSINKELIEKGCMFKADGKEALNEAITNIIENDIKEETKRRIEKAIKYDWMDTTEVILDILTAVANKDESMLEKYKIC